METLERGGECYRVCDPSWRDPLDTTNAKRNGGRWNAPGASGALYLKATLAVAAANARRNFEGEIATLYDLLPEQRPDLVVVTVNHGLFVDIVTAAGLRALRLPASYRAGVSHERCRRIAVRAFDHLSVDGSCADQLRGRRRSRTSEKNSRCSTALPQSSGNVGGYRFQSIRRNFSGDAADLRRRRLAIVGQS